MPITDISFRRGTSTILGTLIFVGIMFTAIIPMMLVMKQVDTIHEMRKYELTRLDEERIREEVYVYAFSPPETSPILTLRVENRGDFVVKIVRIWINDSPHLVEDFAVQPMSWIEMQLDYFTPILDKHYFIKVTTDRGSLFYEDSGSIYFNINGEWEAENFAIFFIISYQGGGYFDVEVKQGSDAGPHVEGSPFSIHKSAQQTAFDYLSVPAAGTYHVKITKSSQVIYNDCVTIYWPDGPRSVTVCR